MINISIENQEDGKKRTFQDIGRGRDRDCRYGCRNESSWPKLCPSFDNSIKIDPLLPLGGLDSNTNEESNNDLALAQLEILPWKSSRQRDNAVGDECWVADSHGGHIEDLDEHLAPFVGFKDAGVTAL